MADVVGDSLASLTGGFNFSGMLGTINLIMLIIIFGGCFFLIIWYIYRMIKFKTLAVIMIKRDKEYELQGWNKIGIFKDKDGNKYAKFRKGRDKIEIPDYKGIIRDKRRGDLVILAKEGEGAYYQVIIPKRFHTIDGKISLPVIDHNVMRQANNQLINDSRKYRIKETTMQKYGTHIAILVVCLVLVIGGYVLLRKEEQLIGLVKDLISSTKGLQDAIVNKAVATPG